ncbi:MAG: lysophospholipid acyltransferase family protein [Candidatus Paceibacterota bacterium]
MENNKTRIFFFVPVIVQIFVSFISYILFKVFAQMEVKGVENIASLKKNVIFASNHSSECDPIIVRISLPLFSMHFTPLYYVSMMKHEYAGFGWKKFFYGGIFFRLLGAYPRYPGHKDYAYSLQNHLTILKKKRNILIFPEGKRTRDGSPGPVHGGVAFLSNRTNTPVVPVAIKGLVNFKLLDLLLFRKKIVVTIGKPIDPLTIIPQTNPTVEDYKKGAQYIMDAILRMV